MFKQLDAVDKPSEQLTSKGKGKASAKPHYLGKEAALSIMIWIPIHPFMPVEHVACPRCGSRESLSYNYCDYCGNMLRPEWLWAYATIICSNCQSRMPLSSKFCPECGHKQ